MGLFGRKKKKHEIETPELDLEKWGLTPDMVDEGDEWLYADDDDPDINSIPFGCRACGGPYPHCTDSCPMFED